MCFCSADRWAVCSCSLDFHEATTHTKKSMWMKKTDNIFSQNAISYVHDHYWARKSSSCCSFASGNISFLIIKCYALRRKKPANCKLFWIGQLLIVSWIGEPSHFECQPYWLSLITPHSMFVYEGNESLTNRGIPPGEVRLHGHWIVMISHLRTLGLFFANFVRRYTVYNSIQI